MMWRRLVWATAVLTVATGCGGDGGGGPVDPNGGTLQGTVTGPGGPIPGAQVSLTGGGSVETDGDGAYTFDDVEAGSKTVTVTPPTGFQLAQGETAAKSVTVASGGTATVNWSVRLADTSPRTVEIGMTANRFSDEDVAVPVGSTINWVNQTSVTHTISPNDPNKAGTWDDTTISGQGTEFDHTFDTAGTFDYVCKLHSGMTGVVRVH